MSVNSVRFFLSIVFQCDQGVRRLGPESCRSTTRFQSLHLITDPSPTRFPFSFLKQFVRHDGTILKKEETKLAQTTYDKVFSCIRMAQREGLLPSDEAEYDHHGAPLPNIFYKDARYEAGSRQGRYLLTNKMPREQYWWLREGYDIGDPVVERDAPRVNEVWPKRTHVLSKYYHDDPRVKRD